MRGVIDRDPRTAAPATVAGTHQDVTEIRATELALRDEVEQSPLMRAISTASNASTSLTEVLDQARALLLDHGPWDRGRAVHRG